ncbi:hypothetical protein MauCBS54593_006174 [Microsporum audouinii]
MVISSALSLLAVSLVYRGVAWGQNIKAAKRTGLPYILTPIHELEFWAYLTNPLLRSWLGGHVLSGLGWPRWARLMIKDWTYEDRGRAHQEYGPVFLVVSPAGLICYIEDPDTATAVCTRRKAFIKPPNKMKMLEPFGPNVVSTDGDLWKFHIRVTVPPLHGDAVHRTVWTETLHRSEILATRWKAAAAGKAAPSLRDGVYDLTVNVMSVAGFEKQPHQQPEKDSTCSPPPLGHRRLSLVESLFQVVTNLPIFVLLPAWLIRFCAHSAYTAYSELNLYMDELLAQEKANIQRRQGAHSTTRARGNLLTAVVESNSQQPEPKTSGPVSSPGGRTRLTDVEVKGNVFMFLLAGYDTTANTILFSTIVLSLYPPIQDAVIAEIRQVHREAVAAGRSGLSYDEDLPKFRYLLAFMHEVMRVFPIVIPITRLAVTEQDLVVGGTKYTLPAQTLTIINNTAIHHNEANWPHPHIIEPRRWLMADPNSFDPTTANTTPPDDPLQPATTTVSQPTVTPSRPGTTHRRGTFMTFNEGPRSCPGRRFAQVEFVAFFAQLLWDHRLGLVDESTAAREDLERQVRLLGGGSPVTLVPPVDVKVCLRAG